jgi:exopolysaccharide biosynthesis polyprenyl glycosylphosphotransferase
MLNHKKQKRKYIICDFFSAALSWALFFMFRKLVIEQMPFNQLDDQVLKNYDFFGGIIFVSFFWLFIYNISGYYHYIYKKTIDSEIVSSIKSSLIGVTILFFLFLLDDQVRNYKNYYLTYSVLFSIQLVLTLIPRLILTGRKIKAVHQNLIYFNTVIIGCGARAEKIYLELSHKKPTDGNLFIGFIKNAINCNSNLENHLPYLGTVEKLPDIINQYHVDEIIIAIEPEEQKDILNIISWLGYSEVSIKAIAELQKILKGHTRITNIMGTPLIEIEYELMPYWQQAIKKIMDFLISLFALIILSPVMLICAIGIKLTSKGPILFKQERIGLNGKPFTLYKFRSMYVDAEKQGPNLSSPNDKRSTPFGKFMRRIKIDEIPNFFNVLKGDMSLVGPRPERQYYIDQIIKIAPQYRQLQKIKPGITSLGQVRYGYACNVDQMVQRMRYDLLYLQNMSLYTDFLIIFYTIRILLKGRHF